MNTHNTLQAVLFDVDGTLADTEQNGHRPAFNAAFKEFGLTWDWDIKLYGELLRITGGKERIRYYMEHYVPDELNKSGVNDRIIELHKSKTKYFEEFLANGDIPLRPGVERLIQQLRHENIRLAIATTTTPENVTNLLKSTLGEESISWFEVIGAGDIVPQKKPAPDIYHWVLDQLGLTAQQCIAMEDSENGLKASLAANLPTIVTINDYTRQQNFMGAKIVLSDLGEPSLPFTVISGDALGKKWVDTQMMQELINHG